MWLRWPSGQSAKVELRDFNLKRARGPDDEAAIIRLIGAVLLEQNDEWQPQHRYLPVEVMARLADAIDPRQIPCAA
jgi:hypothetical protein